MGRRIIIGRLLFIHLADLVFCSGLIVKITPERRTLSFYDELQGSVSISTRQMDITTPITTVPTTTSPLLNPTTDAKQQGGSWCVASQTVPQTALQVALDYACGHGGADCSAIQPGGRCYNPNTVRDQASYAFNSYYHNNPIPSSCNFVGNAVTTTTDPSYGTCQYPSTSTSSSVLNISNSSGSRVFGAGRPITPSTSTAVIPSCIPYSYYILTSLMILLALYITKEMY